MWNVNKNYCEKAKNKKKNKNKTQNKTKSGMTTLPLNENVVWYRAAMPKTRIVHFVVPTDTEYSTFSLNSYHILLRLILINCQKRPVNNSFETASELKTSIDPEFTMYCS